MAGLRLSVLTREYVKVPVSASEVGRPIDPSISGVPEFAFINLATDEDRTPGDGDWKDGVWERFASQIVAKKLVGPDSDTVLPVGEYGVWLRFVVGEEAPSMRAGSLTIE